MFVFSLFPEYSSSQSVTTKDLIGIWNLSSKKENVSFNFGDIPNENNLLIIRDGQQIHATHGNVLETNLDQEMLWIKLKSKNDSTILFYVNIRKVNDGEIKVQIVDLKKPNPGWIKENNNNTLIFIRGTTKTGG